MWMAAVGGSVANTQEQHQPSRKARQGQLRPGSVPGLPRARRGHLVVQFTLAASLAITLAMLALELEQTLEVALAQARSTPGLRSLLHVATEMPHAFGLELRGNPQLVLERRTAPQFGGTDSAATLVEPAAAVFVEVGIQQVALLAHLAQLGDPLAQDSAALALDQRSQFAQRSQALQPAHRLPARAVPLARPAP